MKKATHMELLPHLFRQEYAKMTAVLCRHFGLHHIAVAEDIASDTFLKASEYWAIHGIPDNPVGWLYTVAKNKAKDHLKHLRIVQQHNHEGNRNPPVTEPGFEISKQLIEDSQLAMIFAVCNPSISAESQVCLALQILCGFSVEEIAQAFLTNRETIKKRLHRARHHLRHNAFSLNRLEPVHIQSRLGMVLKTIYLLFNEGYFSRTHHVSIRRDLCSEAIRLALCLVENPLTRTPRVHALVALMCYQSSRLEARVDANGALVLFDKQDRTQWDQELIDRGNYHLVAATESQDISNYHLEAAIAYWHTTKDKNKWSHILLLYDQLVRIESSPQTALGRAFALSKVYGHERAIIETEALKLENNAHYHALLGYLYAPLEPSTARHHYETAHRLSSSLAERQHLQREITRLRDAAS